LNTISQKTKQEIREIVKNHLTKEEVEIFVERFVIFLLRKKG
jgi:hypothetical protein